MNPAIVKFEGWTRRTARARPSASGASKSAVRVRFVVPTSMSRAPARRTMSGMRTPPPISTSSPRDTTTPPRPTRPTASARAAALLFVTKRVLGPGQGDEVILRDARPRAAPPGAAIHLEQEVARGRVRRGTGDRGCPRRPAEVRMDDDAGRVDDADRRGVDR